MINKILEVASKKPDHRTWEAHDAINSYSNFGSSQVNHHLRHGPSEHATVRYDSEKIIRGMDHGFKDPNVHSVATKDINLYRGIPNHNLYSKYKRLGKRLIGKHITDKAYLSTSRSEDYAHRWARQYGEPNILIHIKVPKGTKLLSGNRTEGEYIINRDNKLKIHHVEHEKNERGHTFHIHTTLERDPK